MNIFVKIFTATVIGLASYGTLLYFYEEQRDFSQEYKKISGHFQTLATEQGKLTYDIMRSALFVYHNQDTIAERTKTINGLLDSFAAYTPLNNPRYRLVTVGLERIREESRIYEENLYRYLMINAGVKNSFIFLNAHTEKTHDIFGDKPGTLKQIHEIVRNFGNAKRMFDSDYLHQVETMLIGLRAEEYTEEEQAFMKTFLTHATYITENFPAYIHTIDILLENTPEQSIKAALSVYESTAQNDLRTLDNFAAIFMVIVVSAIFWIVFLLLRSEIENRRLKTLQKTLKHVASHDKLTGLFNRREFEKRLPQLEHPVLILINIDRFKHVNDFYGIDVGNAILKEMGTLIQLPGLNTFDPSYFRLGGDEFGVLLDNVTTDVADSHANTIAVSIEAHPFHIGDFEIFITVSVAINAIRGIMENADMALKHLKANPSGHTIVFSPGLGLKEKVQKNLETTTLVQKAIENDRVIPFFQPIVNLHSGETEKYEVLARIRLDDGTILLPADFLDIAAQTQFYRQITRIIIEKAMRTFESLPYRFSINMSMRDLLDDELMQILRELLQHNSETAKRMEIELLESEQLHDIERVRDFIREMKSFGCAISIDDFGNGYSNFSYLVSLPIDNLKIDGSLISRMKEDPHRFKAVRTIVEYARNLDMRTIAEFVEDQETAEMLLTLGVTYGQGYHFGRPSPTLENR